MHKLDILKNNLKKLINIEVSGRYHNIRSDDIFIVSYPKSGNTWLRFLIANMLYEKVDFNNIDLLIPDIYQMTNKYIDSMKSPRFIKSHETYNAISKRYPRVIYIYRDPRDVMISYYYWQLKYNKFKNKEIKDYISEFIQGTNSIYGLWTEHIDGWIGNNKLNNKILYFSYENLKSNTLNILKEICTFSNIIVDEKKINKAIKNSSFENMQNLEKEQKNTAEMFKDSNKSINFVRKGKNNWQKYLYGDLKTEFKNRFQIYLEKLGYEKNNRW